MKPFTAACALVLLAGSLCPTSVASAQTPAQPDNRIVVKTADDLPRHTYPVQGTALEILKDDAKFNKLVADAIANTRADLEKYRIEDPTTLKGYYDFLSNAYSLQGKDDLALEFSDKAKGLETKEQERLMRGVGLRARLAAKAASKSDPTKFLPAFKAELKKATSALPYEPIKDRLIGVRSQAKMISRELIEASVGATLDPMVEAAKGQLTDSIVVSLIQIQGTLKINLELIPAMAEVYSEIIDAQANAPKSADLWTSRLVNLETSAAGTPVVIGIWDSGVDTSLYASQLWTNPSEQPNGKDDDHNGFVDDIHGIAFGPDHKPTTGDLSSLAGLKGDKVQLIRYITASQDMQAGVQNADVEALQNFVKGLNKEQLHQFTEDTSLLGSYIHGTHVAGIAATGNPFARIVHVTENFPYKAIPENAPTIAEGEAWGQSAKTAVEYLQKAHTRVVNMSWRVGRSAFEGMLEAKGVGANPEERAELSRKIFAGLRSGLESAIRNAPEILFIAGSGNEDNDVDFAEYVPAGLRLPNLLTVGAVDDQLKFTTFTTTGKNVELYSNGFRIENNIPGGQKLKLSGTSMASPQVANLAGKILALRPNLKPAEVVELIRKNADPIAGQPGRLVINPKKTIEALPN